MANEFNGHTGDPLGKLRFGTPLWPLKVMATLIKRLDKSNGHKIHR